MSIFTQVRACMNRQTEDMNMAMLERKRSMRKQTSSKKQLFCLLINKNNTQILLHIVKILDTQKENIKLLLFKIHIKICCIIKVHKKEFVQQSKD